MPSSVDCAMPCSSKQCSAASTIASRVSAASSLVLLISLADIHTFENVYNTPFPPGVHSNAPCLRRRDCCLRPHRLRPEGRRRREVSRRLATPPSSSDDPRRREE